MEWNTGSSTVEPIDDRDSDNPDYRIDPILSSSNTDYGGEDPAVADPDPKPEMVPAWVEADNRHGDKA